MTLKVFGESDVDPTVLAHKVVAILGYGAQGHAHAQNLRDSGVQVVVGQRPGRGFDLAQQHGFHPIPIDEACRQADLINVLLPDEVHGPVFQQQILPNLRSGQLLMACHGFSYTYHQMRPPAGIDYVLVAPKGAGPQVRSQYVAGGGVPCLIATSPDASQQSFQYGLAYAAALGGARAGIFQTTIEAETETDLFGEQVVLCGGVNQLVIQAFETLVQAGYPAELAYFECLHELMLTVDLMHRGGIAYMRDMISNTAEYGDYVAGQKIVDPSTRQRMQEILQNIRSGQFAQQWLQEVADGLPNVQKHRQEMPQHEIEKVGAMLRKRMPWLKT